MEGDSCPFSDTVHNWHSLIKKDDLGQHRNPIKKKFGEAMQPFHFLAYITNHRCLDEWKASMGSVN